MKKWIGMLIIGSMSLLASQKILVDLSQQIAFAYENGKVQFYGRISSGKPGRRTPTGTFSILEKDIDHVSNLWPAPNGGAKMHYMIRLTRDGIAMHLGPTPNHPASHGCIRMHNGFAQKMYFWAKEGMDVSVIGTPPKKSPAFKLPSYNSKKEKTFYTRATATEIAIESTQKRLSPLEALSSNQKHFEINKAKMPIMQPLIHPAIPLPEQSAISSPALSTLTLNEALKKRGIHAHALAEMSSNQKVKNILKETRKKLSRPQKKRHRVNPLRVMRGE